MKEGGYNFLICNVDLAKDALVVIELLQLRLQYEIKVKLNDLDNMDLFHVHHQKKDVVDPEELDNLSYLLQKILPVHQQREIKKQFEKWYMKQYIKLNLQMY